MIFYRCIFTFVITHYTKSASDFMKPPAIITKLLEY